MRQNPPSRWLVRAREQIRREKSIMEAQTELLRIGTLTQEEQELMRVLSPEERKKLLMSAAREKALAIIKRGTKT